MVMYEEEFNQIQTVVDRLVRDANAKVVFIVDKNGQLIAASGDIDNVDTTSLASLTAGNIAATGGMAKLLKENEFATQFHEGLRSGQGVLPLPVDHAVPRRRGSSQANQRHRRLKAVEVSWVILRRW